MPVTPSGVRTFPQIQVLEATFMHVGMCMYVNISPDLSDYGGERKTDWQRGRYWRTHAQTLRTHICSFIHLCTRHRIWRAPRARLHTHTPTHTHTHAHMHTHTHTALCLWTNLQLTSTWWKVHYLWNQSQPYASCLRVYHYMPSKLKFGMFLILQKNEWSLCLKLLMGRETTKQIKTLYTTPSKQNKTKNSNKNQQGQKTKLKQKSTWTKTTKTVNQNNYSPVTHETMAENKLCNV